jgi:hypothetical protein
MGIPLSCSRDEHSNQAIRLNPAPLAPGEAPSKKVKRPTSIFLLSEQIVRAKQIAQTTAIIRKNNVLVVKKGPIGKDVNFEGVENRDFAILVVVNN